MTRIPKIFALVALLVAAGCRDSYPSVQPPVGIFDYPVGLAVRSMPPVAGDPARAYGWSQLVVVNSNFDLRYDEQTGGIVLSVDPDASPDALAPASANPGTLAVLGSMRTGSFGGEVALVQSSCPDGTATCPGLCPQAGGDPVLAAGGARLLLASRSALQIYRMGMDPTGAISCGDGCVTQLPIDRVDPYGVSVACSTRGSTSVAYGFVSQLQSTNGLGWLSRVDLTTGDVLGLVLGDNPTYTSVFDADRDLLFVTSSMTINAQFRWFNPLVQASDVGGFAVPDYRGPAFAGILPGAVARDMALSSDGNRLYVSVQLFDTSLAINAGIFSTLGGGLAIFDLTPTAFAEPRMALVGLERTCVGSGQIRRLPRYQDRPDVFAISCDNDGTLAIYDSDSHTVIRTIGLDPETGLPELGLLPFGIAIESIDPRRATVPVQGVGYPPASPCQGAAACQRIYVGSFYDSKVSILELDPARPGDVELVKQIGRGP